MVLRKCCGSTERVRLERVRLDLLDGRQVCKETIHRPNSLRELSTCSPSASFGSLWNLQVFRHCLLNVTASQKLARPNSLHRLFQFNKTRGPDPNKTHRADSDFEVHTFYIKYHITLSTIAARGKRRLPFSKHHHVSPDDTAINMGGALQLIRKRFRRRGIWNIR